MATLSSDSTRNEQGEEDSRLNPSSLSPSPSPLGPPPSEPQSQKLDAGALFVLKSKGSWLHGGYHLTTSIVAPALLSLPFALASMGWVAGVLFLTIAALVTFYSYNLLSLVLEHHAQLGHRQLRFREMAENILGPRWGLFFVGPIQFVVSYGAVVGMTLLGGQSMKGTPQRHQPRTTLSAVMVRIACLVSSMPFPL